MKENKNRKHLPPRVNEALNAYRTPTDTDPFGSYTGIPEETPCMPRKTVDGKIYKKIEDQPVQDVDDL